jgi:hypothetical protein
MALRGLIGLARLGHSRTCTTACSEGDRSALGAFQSSYFLQVLFSMSLQPSAQALKGKFFRSCQRKGVRLIIRRGLLEIILLPSLAHLVLQILAQQVGSMPSFVLHPQATGPECLVGCILISLPVSVRAQW